MHLAAIILAVFSSFLILAVAQKEDYLIAEYGPLGSKADFYDEEFLQGGSVSLETEGPCKNLPAKWRKKAVSVDMRGTCFTACDAEDCGGNCKRLFPPNGEQQLKTINWDKKIVSMQGCFYKKRSGPPPVKVKVVRQEEEDY